MEKHKQRLQEINETLNSDTINLKRLKELCSQGNKKYDDI